MQIILSLTLLDMCLQNTNLYIRKLFITCKYLSLVEKLEFNKSKQVCDKAKEFLLEWDKEFSKTIPDYGYKKNKTSSIVEKGVEKKMERVEEKKKLKKRKQR